MWIYYRYDIFKCFGTLYRTNSTNIILVQVFVFGPTTVWIIQSFKSSSVKTYSALYMANISKMYNHLSPQNN
jgi:hypothetical protein